MKELLYSEKVKFYLENFLGPAIYTSLSRKSLRKWYFWLWPSVAAWLDSQCTLKRFKVVLDWPLGWVVRRNYSKGLLFHWHHPFFIQDWSSLSESHMCIWFNLSHKSKYNETCSYLLPYFLASKSVIFLIGWRKQRILGQSFGGLFKRIRRHALLLWNRQYQGEDLQDWTVHSFSVLMEDYF